MNKKKLKMIFILLIIFLIIIVVLFTFFKGFKIDNSSNGEEEGSTHYIYNFGETLNLEQSATEEDSDNYGSDFPSLGLINDFYDDANVETEDQAIFLDTQEGRILVSAVWREEGKATLITEPTFGGINKFILKPYSVSARYTGVSRKDVVSYINELAGLGFDNVIKNEENKKNDYYNYVAEKGENSVVLIYEKGTLIIEVY